MERDVGRVDRKEGGQVFMVVEKSSKARQHTPCLI
jgi:hypothetical protein